MTHRMTAGVATLAALLATTPAWAQSGNRGLQTVTDGAKVTGHMTIDFNSRSVRNSNGLDMYAIEALTVADLMAYSGSAQRKPEDTITYSLKIDVNNPANPSQVAKEVAILRGETPIDEGGRYQPESGNLRLDIVKGQQSSGKFDGVIQGREVTRWWELGEQISRASKAADKLYSRTVNGKVVTIQVKNPDPLSFQGLVLAPGPLSFLPQTRVSGNLDYDYELGNWLTDNNGISFQYAIGNQAYTDKVTGSIRYVEEEGSFNDAKGQSRNYTGYYDYNLRFNEPVVKPEETFFGGENNDADVEAFFGTVEQNQAGLYGRVYYLDSEDGCRREKNESGQMQCVGPTRSEVYWDLKPVKLTYSQLGNWFKLEPLMIGPFNDE